MNADRDLTEYLFAREPLFDRPDCIWDAATFEAEIAPDFSEVGASGRCYSRAEVRAVVLGRLAGTHPQSLAGGYRMDDADVRLLTPSLAQVRYTLHAQGRVTRRSTLYRRADGRWQAVFHQGTVVEGLAPLPPNQAGPERG